MVLFSPVQVIVDIHSLSIIKIPKQVYDYIGGLLILVVRGVCLGVVKVV